MLAGYFLSLNGIPVAYLITDSFDLAGNCFANSSRSSLESLNKVTISNSKSSISYLEKESLC